MRKSQLVSLLQVALSLLLLIATGKFASPASAATLKVDDDGAQCGATAYTTIQAAVDAASSGDRISICPGTYAEKVTVDKSLKFHGKAPDWKTCNTLGALDPTLHSIIDAPAVVGVNGIGLDLFADKVSIQHLVIRQAGEVAIRTDPLYSGFSLKKTILVGNANGLYLHSSGVMPSSVKLNCFRQNPQAGIRTRYGLANVSMSENLFFQNDNAAVIIDQEVVVTNSALTLERNKSQNDGTFAVVLGTADSRVRHNEIADTTGTAIFVGGNNVDLEISKNQITNAGTRGIRFNTAAFGGNANTGVWVMGNLVTGAGRHGIVADSGAGESTLINSIIEKNVVTNSGTGIDGGDGIRLEDPTLTGSNGGNTIRKNNISGSFHHDCHDGTAGTGTAGSANTWDTSNTAATQNLANLCFTGAANGVAE